jgi:hypothetical protein
MSSTLKALGHNVPDAAVTIVSEKSNAVAESQIGTSTSKPLNHQPQREDKSEEVEAIRDALAKLLSLPGATLSKGVICQVIEELRAKLILLGVNPGATEPPNTHDSAEKNSTICDTLASGDTLTVEKANVTMAPALTRNVPLGRETESKPGERSEAVVAKLEAMSIHRFRGAPTGVENAAPSTLRQSIYANPKFPDAQRTRPAMIPGIGPHNDAGAKLGGNEAADDDPGVIVQHREPRLQSPALSRPMQKGSGGDPAPMESPAPFEDGSNLRSALRKRPVAHASGGLVNGSRLRGSEKTAQKENYPLRINFLCSYIG